MKPHEFIGKLDHDQIAAAIAEAERTTSGEIRVFIAHQRVTDALAAARMQFLRLAMTKTRQRNAVLLFLAPRTRHFAVWGDQGVHEKCGDDFWREIVSAATARLGQGNFSEAVIGAVQRTGEVLARHFPREPDDRNELPDAVVSD